MNGKRKIRITTLVRNNENKKETYANLCNVEETSYVVVLGEGECPTGECPGNMSGGTCPVPAVPN